MTGSQVSDAAHTGAVQTVATARAAFESGRTKPLDWRLGQLRALRRMLVDNEGVFAEALRTDLGKGSVEAWLTEIGFLVAELDHTVAHLRSWLAPRQVSVPLSLQPARASVVREPRGVCLVIAPWNYPLQLLLAPLVGALAGGNAVVLKPSEIAAATSRAVAQVLPAYLDAQAVHVVEGGIPETTALLEQRFDHIFYTGNAHVGRIVHTAATKYLTPVTLELGGKSPTFVDAGVDLAVVARRLVWGKFLNAGQTCVAPDYVMATRPVLDALVPLVRKAIVEFFGDDPAQSHDYGRIVNDQHLSRVSALISGDVVIGGEVVAAERYVAPTVIDHAGAEHPAMQSEIFGPVLPLVEVSGVDEAIAHTNRGEKPLALYVFTDDVTVKRRFIRDTSSGAINFGIPLAHLTVPDLPFGGVGESGLGSYHGQASLDVFTHAKSVLDKPLSPDSMLVVYPPANRWKEKVIRAVVARAPRRRS